MSKDNFLVTFFRHHYLGASITTVVWLGFGALIGWVYFNDDWGIVASITASLLYLLVAGVLTCFIIRRKLGE